MALTAATATLLLDALPTIEKTRYAELSSTVIILFDHIITLDQERTHWSLGKALFLVNRYYALCIVVCLAWFRWQGWTGVITFIIAELILQLRLYALYFRDKRVLVGMVLVCLATAATSAYVMGSALNSVGAIAITLPEKQSTVCVPTHLPTHFYAFWIPMLISESILCGLALLRGFKAYSPGSNMFQNGKRIIEVLVRDSLFYFVIIFATYLINTILFFSRPDSEVEIPIGFAVALSVVLSNRLCLNVRGYIRDEHASLSSLPPPPHGGVALVSLPRSPGHTGYAYRHGNARRGGERYSARDDPEERDGDESADEREHERTFGQATISIVHGGVLSEVELRELRAMRAQSPKQLRTFG
ncbi:hypothetical protein C2E23DRAFT_744190 [Lenzites betulinus]|nr:hypothetical protein C2E23DRAFT_744190 [Lenzites betulinus]